MLRKTTITAAILGAAMSFMTIGAPTASATDSPFVNPMEAIPIAYCLEEGGVWVNHECVAEVAVGPVGVDPGVLVIVIPDETSAALATPEVEIEPSTVMIPDAGEPEETEGGSDAVTEAEEGHVPATEPTSESASDGEHTHEFDSGTSEEAASRTQSVPIVEADSAQDPRSANEPEGLEVDSSDEVTQAANYSDSLDLPQTESLATDQADAGKTNPVLAALLGVMGAVALFGAVVVGVVIGRRAN